MHKMPPLPVRIVLALIVVSVIVYFGFTSLRKEDTGKITASGTIESVTVNVSPEMAGKVKDVFVAEGQPIKTGDPLLSLDDSLLAAQRKVAQSGVDSARNALLTVQSAYGLAEAQYAATLNTARAQEGSQRLTDWSNRTPGQFSQPLWYFSQEEQIASAQAEVDSSGQALGQAQTELAGAVQDLNNSSFEAAESRLSDARTSYLIAKAVHNRAQLTGGKVRPEDVQVDLPDFVPAYRVKIAIAKRLSGESDVLTAAQSTLDSAETELDEAQRAYDDLLTTDAGDSVLESHAALSVAQERYEVALDMLSRLQTGEFSLEVKISSIALEQAKAAQQQAEGAVHQAEANLALLDTQIAKLTVYAPMDGAILTRNVEPGEFVQPGAVAITMADLKDLTITVYIPEDRYGQITLGQQAQVTVDSFPDEIFNAEVVHVADEAEFTPRNVQTVEGRSSTVFAIKLRVTDSAGKLKIGMPADVLFK